MSKQENFWRGEGGDAYLERNRVEWRKRIPFWRNVVEKTGIRSASELGCNAGWNLSAIRRSDIYGQIQVYGVDINSKAAFQAQCAGIKVYHSSSPYCADLVFTAGVLIHINSDDLHAAMNSIVEASFDYVLAVEYESESGEEEEVEYRGQSGLLWRRDYGKMYQDMGLELIEKWDAGEAFDRCTAWLLRK